MIDLGRKLYTFSARRIISFHEGIDCWAFNGQRFTAPMLFPTLRYGITLSRWKCFVGVIVRDGNEVTPESLKVHAVREPSP